MENLDIIHEKNNKDLTILKLRGSFEGLQALDAKDRLLGYVEESHQGQMVELNFEKVEYIDSAAISVLIDMASKANERSIKFVMTGVNENIRKILAVTRLDKVFTIR